MDKSSMKPKPVPPPKPSTRLSAQFMPESSEKDKNGAERSSADSKGLTCDNIYSEISERNENKNVHHIVLLKKTGEGRKRDVSAIKSPNLVSVPSVSQSPKPPLLPKPTAKHISLQPKSSALRSTSQTFSGQMQKDESSVQAISSLSPKSVQSRKANTGLAPLSLRAPVATFEEEFESYEKEVAVTSPVRPPRSPKIKTFVGGPFEKLDTKPELPVKKRLQLVGNDGMKHLQNAKKRSLSLGRTVNLGLIQDGNKSQSLGRNLSLSEQLAACTGAKIGPVPPPRRRNKSEEITRFSPLFNAIVDLKEMPVYAAVNYEMKKNRRTKVEKTVVPSLQLETGTDEVFQNEIGSVVEGKLLLGNVDTEKDNNCSTQVEMNQNNSLACETSNHSLGNPCLAVVTENNDMGLDTNIIQVTAPNIQANVVLSVGDELESQSTSEGTFYDVGDEPCVTNDCDEGRPKSLKHLTKGDTDSYDNFLVPVSSNLDLSGQATSDGVDKDQRLQKLSNDQTSDLKVNSSELYRIMSTGLTTELQSVCNKSDEAVAIETCDSVNNELILISMQNLDTTTIIVDESPKNLNLHKDNNDSIDCTKCDIESIDKKPAASCDELPNVSDLVIVKNRIETMSEEIVTTPDASKQNVMHLWQRQSCSSSKDTTPSPERCPSSSVGKHKHQKQQSWCDDGDLSNGVLADSDTGSSDNTARLSHEDVHSVRSKVSAWFDFGSMGKGAKKRNKERKARSNSQFYSEDENAQPPNLRSVSSPSICNESLEKQPLNNTVNKCEEDSESDNEEQQGHVTDNQKEHQQRERKVFYIAQELMTSEKEFVNVLKLLNVKFSQAVNAAGTNNNPVIPKSEFSKIINSLPQLQRLNEDLLQDLQHRIENWSSLEKIADVIVKKGPFLKLYSSYIQNFESQCNLLDECCQKYPRFSKVVKEFEASPCCKKLNIKHFMLKPVQRIPQYRLLLEDYLQHLDNTSPDYQDTEEALRIVRDVAEHANRSVKLGDHLSKLIELQSQLSNYEIIKPGRQFVKEGELFKLSRKGRHPRFFILLNDCLLYTSKSNTSLIRVNNELPLNGMKVNLPQVEDYRCEFSIISVTRSFTLAASSIEERADWITALQNSIKEHTERQRTFQIIPKMSGVVESFKLGQQAPVWIQDSRVTMCQSCTTQFTVMFRRHHCRACGKVVCGVCSDNKAPLQYMRFHAARVCEECHDVLLQEFEDPTANMIETIMKETGQLDPIETEESMRSLFRKSAAGGKKLMLQKKDIPQRLKEVAANDSGSQMSGWLQRRGRRSWKRLWFVLKEQVLYVYKASEDVVALESIPVLGYKLEPMTERHFQIYEGIDARLVFQLAHLGQLPLVFHADTEHMANRWMQAMQEATVLM